MTPPGIFSGADRVEFLKSFGRPVRLGSLEALKVSDGSRVRTSLRQQDLGAARNLLKLLQPMHAALVTTYLEWAYALRSFTVSRVGEEKERVVAKKVSRTWSEGIQARDSSFRKEAVECVRGLLDPDKNGPATIEAFRKAGGNPWAATLNQIPGDELAALHRSLDQGDVESAIRHFDEYLAAVRDRHDLIGRSVALTGTVLASEIGQRAAVDSPRRASRAAPCSPACGASSARRRPRSLS